LDASQAGNNTYKWFKNGNEIIGETNSTYEVLDAGTYSVEVTLDNACIAFGEVVIEYATNPVIQDSVLVECDQDQDGITLYNLFEAEQELTNNDQTLLVTNFYLSENDAIIENNPIQNPTNFQNSIPLQTVYARVENRNGCFNVPELQLQIANNVINIPDAESCDGQVVDGFAEFDLDAITTSFQGQIPNDAVVNYYETETNAFNETNSLNSPYTNAVANAQTLYVKVISNNQCYVISTVNLNVLPTPSLLLDESIFYCLNSFPQTIRLEAGVLNTNPNSYTYEWLFSGNSTLVNTSFYDINETGTYTVVVTDPNGCSATRNISVTPSNVATIESISVIEASVNNSVTIQVSGEGEYLFTMDHANGFYQESNTFTNVRPGFHTIYVQDKNGCGIREQLISVLGFPKFVTPNGDGFNDTWKVYGVNANFNQDIQVKIFDRFGKLLSEQNNLSLGWDGTFNGYPLPGDDYWFLITFEDGRTYRGHFALVR
jgi:gliding motility-associated-like protein